ncbi:MAG TPA: glutathione S-transferase family protein [Solirubrobacterales bacterium]|jgi:glutathione S-transferase|nr:glutathione S-transferase family protein [Solirubrobacterales bacterium]
MSLTLHEHPFAAYCWKPLIALYEREVPFERHFVGGEEDRAELAKLWPPASIPVLRDEGAGITVPESTTIVEYVDSFGEAPPLIPSDPLGGRATRLWDRVIDGQVATPMQKIVADALRPEESRDPFGVAEARAGLDATYELLDEQLSGQLWLAGETFTLADCAAAAALHYAYVLNRWDESSLQDLTRYFADLMARPAVARVVDEAREYRPLFPLPWPDYVP